MIDHDPEAAEKAVEAIRAALATVPLHGHRRPLSDLDRLTIARSVLDHLRMSRITLQIDSPDKKIVDT